MMFQVEWLQIALDELTNLWTQADSIQRQAITAASHVLEQRLKSDTFVSPLAVRFQIEADGQTVTVLHVRLFGRRKK